jgi:hypothetical protein
MKVLSKQADVLFIWIPKVAGSSIYRSLRESRCGCRRFLNREKQGKVEGPYTDFDNRGAVTFGHASVDVLLEHGIVSADYFERAFKFCFVRNPWDRLVSLFHYRRLDEKYGDFERFCLEFQDQDVEPVGLFNSEHNSQFNDQASWIVGRDGRWLVDFVGRYERLSEDFERICRILGIRTRLPHRNRADRSHYREYYTPRTVEIVRRKYARDIELFGYDF